MRRPQLHSSSSSSLVTIFSLVLVTLSLASFSSIHVHAQSLNCSQVDTVTLRALNGTDGTQINNVTVQGLYQDPVTSPVFVNIPFSTNLLALSSFIGRAYGCNTSGSTFYELNLRLNNTQYTNFTRHIQNAVATAGVNMTSSVLSTYFASFTRGAASPICNATDCPLAPTTPPTTPAPTTATPTTSAPTVSGNTTNAPNTTAAPTTTAPTVSVNTTNAPNTTAPPTTTAPTTNVTAAPTSTPTPTSAPTTITNATTAPPTNATTAPPTTTSAPTTTLAPTTTAPTTPAPTSSPTFPPQRCFNVTRLEDRNISSTYPIVTNVWNLENVTEPLFIDVIELESYFENETFTRNVSIVNSTFIPRIEIRNQTLYNVTYNSTTIGNVTTQQLVSNISYIIQNQTTVYDNVTNISYELRNDTRLVTKTRNVTVSRQQFTILNQTTWRLVNHTFIENVTTPVNESISTIVPRIINGTVVTININASRPFNTILNQSSILPNQTVIGSLIVNVTLFNITYTNASAIGNITRINVTGTEIYTQTVNQTDTITTFQIRNQTAPDNVTRVVNETSYTLIPIPLNHTVLKNVSKTVTNFITNYTMVPTLVDTQVCVNQSCFLEYYNEFRPVVEMQVTSVQRSRQVSVIDLQPLFAPITTLQSTNVTVYTLTNVTRNFTILQETIIYDYANVTTVNTSTISTPYLRLENVTTTHYNTSITNITVYDPVQTGVNNRSITHNITIYTPITRLQNVTRIETRPALRNVTVTRINITTVNASVSVPTSVVIATTVLRSVTYLENVTKPENVSVTSIRYEMRSVPFQNLTHYNNVTTYTLTNVTDTNFNKTFPNGTWAIVNETRINVNVTGWTLEPVYTNATRMENTSIPTTTYELQNKTREENVTRELNITTFTPTVVNVREFRLINVTNTFNETVLQNVTVPFPVTRLENVTVEAPTGFMLVTNYTLDPVFTQVPRIVANTTLIPYNVTRLENVTHYNITTVTTSTTTWTVIGQRSIFTPIVVQRNVTELVSQTITVQAPQAAQVVVGYTPVNTTTTVNVMEQNFTAVVNQVPYNVSRIVCNDIPTTPPPTTLPPTTPAPTTPPPNVTVAICSVEDVAVYVNVPTPRWELVNTTFTNNYTVQVIRPVNTTFPNITTIYEMKNNTYLVNGTREIIQYEMRNQSVPFNQSTTTNTFQFINSTRYINRTENAIIGYNNITTPIIIPTSVSVPVNRTFRIPVITNVSTTINITRQEIQYEIIQEPVYLNQSVQFNDTEFYNENYIENVTRIVPNITYQMVNTSSTTPIFNGTRLVTRSIIKDVARVRNVTIQNGTRVESMIVNELVSVIRLENVTVPQQTIFVPITIPMSWRLTNVSYPNGTFAILNITSDPVTVSVPVVIPSFQTLQNVTRLENRSVTRYNYIPTFITVERNTTQPENVTEPFFEPVQIGTNITWSMVNTTIINNATIIVPENRTRIANRTVERTRIDVIQNGTRPVNVTRTVEIVTGTNTTWSLQTSFNNVTEIVNVSTTLNVPASRIDYQPIVAPVERVVQEFYQENVTVPVTNYTVINRTELRNVSVSQIIPIQFNQTRLENVSRIVSAPYWAFVNQTFNETRVNTTWAWVNHTSIIQVPTLTGYVPTTVCRNFTGFPGSILWSSGVAVNPTDAFCTKLAGSNNATRQWNAVKNIIRWSFQGINETGFASVNFPGWLNHPAIAPYFRGQFIYDPPYTSPFADLEEFNIDFTSSLYVDEYATLIEHFVQYFGASWGCIGQKGDRFPGYQGNPRMDVIHGGMAINYATYRTFYNQLVRALVARGTSSQDINEFIVPYFEHGPFLRGGALAICTQLDCPCAPGTNLCSGQCLPRCPVLATDPICIKVSKLNTPFGLTDTNSSFAALQSVLTLAFRGSQGVVRNGVAVEGLLAPGSLTAPLYNMNGRNLSAPDSTVVLTNIVSNYVRFLGPLLGCNSNPLDGNFSVYQGRPIGSVHAALNINLATYTYWFTQVELALRFYGAPLADINSIRPGFFNTFTRGSPVAVCTAADCPCAIGYVANGTDCSLATTAPPPTSAPTKGQPTLVPTLPPSTPSPSSNVTTQPPTTTATPTTASPTTPTSTPTTPSPTTNPNGTTAPPTTPPTLTPGGTASTIQVSICALFTLAVATVMAMQL